MKKCTVAVLGLTIVGLAYAGDDAKYLGDKIKISSDVKGEYHKLIMGPAGSIVSENRVVCVPNGTKFIGASDLDDGAGISLQLLGKAKDCVSGVELDEGVILQVAKKDFVEARPVRHGFSYGALLVPYKAMLSGSKELKGGSSIGPYLGYRYQDNRNGFELKPIVFVGGSTVSVSDTSESEVKTTNLAAVTYGTGLLFSIKNEFQIGVVVGWDRVNQSSGYYDNQKPWLAVAIGYSFSQ